MRSLSATDVTVQSLADTALKKVMESALLGRWLVNEESTLSGLGEDWHYGFGLWQECQSTEYNCVPGSRVSSPGHFGGYPFWDRDKSYTGVVMRQGTSATVINGIKIERTVRPDVERWAAC